jgi:hypothetical protein
MDSDGTWVPTAPGYLVAAASEDANPMKAYNDPGTSAGFGYFYAGSDDGGLTRVMRLEGLMNTYGGFGSPAWNDSGSGVLYAEGASVLVAGALTWQLM